MLCKTRTCKCRPSYEKKASLVYLSTFHPEIEIVNLSHEENELQLQNPTKKPQLAFLSLPKIEKEIFNCNDYEGTITVQAKASHV